MAEVIKVEAYKRGLIKGFNYKSTRELSLYKETGDEESLRQAAEKVWGAYVQIVKQLNEKRFKLKLGPSTKTILLIGRKIQGSLLDGDLKLLHSNAHSLHRFFYEGGDEEEFIKKIEESNDLIDTIVFRFGLE